MQRLGSMQGFGPVNQIKQGDLVGRAWLGLGARATPRTLMWSVSACFLGEWLASALPLLLRVWQGGALGAGIPAGASSAEAFGTIRAAKDSFR
jgi:hypothetical protein